MADVGPWLITARSKEHAEYLVRSRAETRGVRLQGIDVSGGDNDMWSVTVSVDDAAKAEAARLGDDTQVLHLDTHRRP